MKPNKPRAATMSAQLRAEWWVLMACCVFAGSVWGAEIRRIEPWAIPLWSWLGFGLAVVFGFLASASEVLFGVVASPTWKSTGKLCKVFFTSLLAGFFAFFIALQTDAPPLYVFLSVGGAAWAGEAYLRKWLDKVKPTTTAEESK